MSQNFWNGQCASKLCTRTERARCDVISAEARNLSCRIQSFCRFVENKLNAATKEFFRALFTVDWADTRLSSCCMEHASWTKANFRKSNVGSNPFLNWLWLTKKRCYKPLKLGFKILGHKNQVPLEVQVSLEPAARCPGPLAAWRGEEAMAILCDSWNLRRMASWRFRWWVEGGNWYIGSPILL